MAGQRAHRDRPAPGRAWRKRPATLRTAILIATMLCIPWVQAEASDASPTEGSAEAGGDLGWRQADQQTLQQNGTNQNATQDGTDQNATQDGTDQNGTDSGQDGTGRTETGRETTASMPWIILALLTILLFAIARFGP